MKHARGFVSREDEKQVKFVIGQYFEVSSFAIHLVSFFFWEIQNAILCPPTSVDAIA
jgi:hypothetical protein